MQALAPPPPTLPAPAPVFLPAPTAEVEPLFKYARLPENYTDADIDAELRRLAELKTDYANKDAALKVILNSIYGVAGYLGFILYDRDVAQSITKQCEHLTKFTIAAINEFFSERFQDLHDLHAALQLPRTPEPWAGKVVNYADTDSMFFVFGPFRRAIGHVGDPVDFIMTTYQMHLKEFIRKKLEDYIVERNGFTRKKDGTPAVELDLEEICQSVLWVASKKYIKDPIFVKKKKIPSMSKLTVKGLELNQAATPKFVRSKLQHFVNMIMSSDGAPDLGKMVSWLASVKNEFRTLVTDPENVSRIERANDYHKYVINDKEELVIGPNCKPHCRGAGLHNLLLNESKVRYKYEFIRSSQKVHFYYTKRGSREEVFSFLPGNWPAEFAPEMDVDIQFEKVLLGPVNNILRAMKIPPLTSSLVLFDAMW